MCSIRSNITATILHVLLFVQALACVATADAASTFAPSSLRKDTTTVTAAGGGNGSADPDSAFATGDNGLLWRVSGIGPAPSYLFGTMHVDDPRVVQLPEIVQDTFAGSASLTLEAKLDLASLAAAASKMLLGDGKTLRELLHGELYADVQRLLESRGVPAAAMDRFKPWVVSVMLGIPRSRSSTFLDQMLNDQALSQGKPVYGIETLDEQIALFDDLSLADQITLVTETVRKHEQLPEMIEKLTQAYLRRDLTALADLAQTHMRTETELAQTLQRNLIVERNQKMVDRIRTRLTEGNAFIAVGALHLPGPDGMLQLLRNRGLTIEAIY